MANFANLLLSGDGSSDEVSNLHHTKYWDAATDWPSLYKTNNHTHIMITSSLSYGSSMSLTDIGARPFCVQMIGKSLVKDPVNWPSEKKVNFFEDFMTANVPCPPWALLETLSSLLEEVFPFFGGMRDSTFTGYRGNHRSSPTQLKSN